MGRSLGIKKLLGFLFAKTDLPTVIDADGLFFLSRTPSWKLPKTCILTPHVGEMEKLLKMKRTGKNAKEFFLACQDYSEKKKATLVLKRGSDNCLSSQGAASYYSPRRSGNGNSGIGRCARRPHCRPPRAKNVPAQSCCTRSFPSCACRRNCRLRENFLFYGSLRSHSPFARCFFANDFRTHLFYATLISNLAFRGCASLRICRIFLS